MHEEYLLRPIFLIQAYILLVKMLLQYTVQILIQCNLPMQLQFEEKQER